MAADVSAPFDSRLIAADFARDQSGQWHFMEAGAGAAAGTGHQDVFKSVALRLSDKTYDFTNDNVGGVFAAPKIT